MCSQEAEKPMKSDSILLFVVLVFVFVLLLVLLLLFFLLLVLLLTSLFGLSALENHRLAEVLDGHSLLRSLFVLLLPALRHGRGSG